MSAPERPRPSFLFLAAGSAAAYFLYRFHSALSPFVLAAALAYAANPAIAKLQAWGLRRALIVVAAYAALGGLGFGAYSGARSLIVGESDRFLRDAPAITARLQKTAAERRLWLARCLPLPRQASEAAIDSAVATLLDKFTALPSGLLGLIPLLGSALLVPLIGFYFLLDGPDGIEGLIQRMPSRYVEQTLHVLGEIDSALGGYLRGLLITVVAISVASLVGLVLLDVDNAIEIAALSGLASAVPYMGAVVGILVGGGMAMFQFGSLWAGVKVALLFIGIRVVDEALLQPVISRHSMHLHPMVSLAALIVGGEAFGFLGLVFALPAACILKALISVTWTWYASETGLDPSVVVPVPTPYT